MTRFVPTLLAVLLTGCTATITTQGSPASVTSPGPTPTTTAPASAAPRVLEAGAPANGEDSAQGKVARSQAEWVALYAAVSPEKPTPSVDFSKEMVVAVYAGAKSDAGYAVAVKDVAYGADKVAVSYAVTHKDGVYAQVISFPYVFVAVTRSDKPVNFQDASPKP